ncbi:MAG: Rab family GTPase [Candidatus Helarchaeota archaeon]
MAELEILKGIIFSLFTDKGPEPKFWFPMNLDQDMLLKISVKNITLLAGESGESNEQIAFVQFPNYQLSTFVYLFGIPNENVRGKNIAASISLLIVDKYNSIFYLNMNEFKDWLKQLSQEIIKNEMNNQPSDKVIVDFYYKLKEKVMIFNRHEITTFKIKDSIILDNEAINEQKYKLGIVGAPAVGKTAILLRFCEEAFRDKYIATNGANVNIKSLILPEENTRISFYLWDISSQPCYLDMNEKLIEGCDAIIYVYDITRLDSFKEINYWYNWILEKIGYKIGVLVGNKIDLERKVPKEDAKNLARNLKLGYIETSAKNGTNVHTLFQNVAKAVFKLYKTNTQRK